MRKVNTDRKYGERESLGGKVISNIDQRINVVAYG